MPAFLNKMRVLFNSGQYLENYQLDSNLRYILDSIRKIEPAVYPSFCAMYYLGCRASESIDRSLWSVNPDNSYTLQPLKNNDVRHFDSFEVPFEFQLFIEGINVPDYNVNYERLRYLFKMFSIYPRIWVGKKESTCHLFRHNYVKKLLSQSFTNEEIRVKLGEKNMKSALAYIDSQFRI